MKVIFPRLFAVVSLVAFMTAVFSPVRAADSQSATSVEPHSVRRILEAKHGVVCRKPGEKLGCFA